MLRGCSLKNIDFIYGLAVYTGHETKIMLNSVKSKTKKINSIKKSRGLKLNLHINNNNIHSNKNLI